MIGKKIINKVLKKVFFFSLVLSIISIPGITYAADKTPVPKTHVKITNTETGKVTQYDLNDFRTQRIIDKDGEEVFVSTFNIEDKQKYSLNSTQTNEDTLGGYTGTVKITYTDDGKYACLKSVYASWEKVSGNSTIINKSLNYGQVLGTNSKRGYTKISGNAVSIITSFKPGKIGYGLDFFLGATLNAKIGSNQVAIECNVNY